MVLLQSSETMHTLHFSPYRIWIHEKKSPPPFTFRSTKAVARRASHAAFRFALTFCVSPPTGAQRDLYQASDFRQLALPHPSQHQQQRVLRHPGFPLQGRCVRFGPPPRPRLGLRGGPVRLGVLRPRSRTVLQVRQGTNCISIIDRTSPR